MPPRISTKKKMITWVLFTLLGGVLLLGGSIYNLAHNKRELHRLTKKRARLDTQYQALLEERNLLEEKQPTYMETLARTRYNMVKPGEIEFRFNTHDKH